MPLITSSGHILTRSSCIVRSKRLHGIHRKHYNHHQQQQQRQQYTSKHGYNHDTTLQWNQQTLHHHRTCRISASNGVHVRSITKRNVTMYHPTRQSKRRSSTTSTTSASSAGTSTTATMSSLPHQHSTSHTLTAILEEILRKPRTIPIPRWITPRHYTITYSELFGHSSFILVAISYAVDDFLLLRSIAVAGSTAMLFFTYFHPHGRVLWLPFKWNVLFIAINSYRIGKVYLDRYFAEQLSPELLQLRQKHFYVMDPVDFYRLVRIAKIQEFQKNEVIQIQGQRNRFVRVILHGRIRVLRDGGLNYYLEQANFVSESGLHAGILLTGGSIESCCTLVSDGDGDGDGDDTVKVLTWDRSELIDLMEHHDQLRNTLKAVLTWDIVRKLKAQRALIASGEITDVEEWNDRRNRQTFHRYAAILHNLLLHPEERLQKSLPELNKYRMIHNIDDDHHNMALRAVGWTPEEFANGKKDNIRDWEHEEDDPNFVELKHDWKWYVRDLYLRFFG